MVSAVIVCIRSASRLSAPLCLLIDKLKTIRKWQRRADAVKSYLKVYEALTAISSELWGDLREWLEKRISTVKYSRVKETYRAGGSMV